MTIGADFSQLSPHTALLAGKIEPESDISTATTSGVDAMWGTTSPTPLVAALDEKYGL
jgi:hypothetical protein